MVLTERPQATLVASDLFGTSFTQHFGAGERPQDRLLANLKAAGVDERATVETADMLKLPFADRAFDAIVSAYTMDHLGRNGARMPLVSRSDVHSCCHRRLGRPIIQPICQEDHVARHREGGDSSHCHRNPRDTRQRLIVSPQARRPFPSARSFIVCRRSARIGNRSRVTARLFAQ